MPSLFYIFRTGLYSGVLFVVSMIAVVEGAVMTLIGKRMDTNWLVARTFLNVAGPIMGWKFEVEGEEYLFRLKEKVGAGHAWKSAVLVGNHQSFVDIMYLGRIFPKHSAIMSKAILKWVPGLGWFMLMSGTVFINRSNNKSAVGSMTQAGEDMKRKKISLWIFPEGTRHNTAEPDLLPFKKGAFYLAIQSGTPIIPVVCQNYNHLFDGKTRFKSGTLKIKVLPPIPTTDMTIEDVPALMEKTRNAMVKTLREISQPSSKDSASEPLLSTRQSGNYDATASEEESDKSSDNLVDVAAEEEPTRVTRPAKTSKPRKGKIAIA